MNDQTVGIVGAGQMGAGIAQVFACAGYRVRLHDQSESMLSRGLKSVEASLKKLESKGYLNNTTQAILSQITPSHSIEELAGSDLLIEAIVENEAAKAGLLQKLSTLCHENTILATNTSSISITRLAQATDIPERVIGMHFMNPVPLIQLVEIIPAYTTTPDTIQAVKTVVNTLGKESVLSTDRPGFIVNRLLIPMINEAIFVLEQGIGSAEEIDKAMVMGCAQPIGPLSLADMIGLDTCLNIMNVLYAGFKDPKYRPSPLLVEMVDSKILGRKTGQGFFEYN